MPYPLADLNAKLIQKGMELVIVTGGLTPPGSEHYELRRSGGPHLSSRKRLLHVYKGQTVGVGSGSPVVYNKTLVPDEVLNHIANFATFPRHRA
jgi:hypothetical protein